jgi:hypothetical protein
MKRKATPEGALLRLVMDWLSAEHIFALRMNVGVMRNAANRPVHFGIEGTADILAFPVSLGRPHPVWIELKAGKNGQSESQRSFQRHVEERGHTYLLAYSLDDVIEMLGRQDGRLQ